MEQINFHIYQQSNWYLHIAFGKRRQVIYDWKFSDVKLKRKITWIFKTYMTSYTFTLKEDETKETHPVKSKHWTKKAV